MDEVRRAWQKHPLVLLAAACVGVLPLYALIIYSDYQSINTTGFQVPDISSMLLNVLVMVVGFGGWMTVLLYVICGERFTDLLLKAGNLVSDISQGLLLALALLLSQFTFAALMSSIGSSETPAATTMIAKEIAGDPVLLILWLGPVIWLQAAVFEEYARVFLLSRLWQVWRGDTARWLVLLGSSLLFGLGHLYQGAYGILGTALIGFILGWHYLKYGRVVPLMIAHGVYDTVALGTLVYLVNSGTL